MCTHPVLHYSILQQRKGHNIIKAGCYTTSAHQVYWQLSWHSCMETKVISPAVAYALGNVARAAVIIFVLEGALSVLPEEFAKSIPCSRSARMVHGYMPSDIIIRWYPDLAHIIHCYDYQNCPTNNDTIAFAWETTAVLTFQCFHTSTHTYAMHIHT